MLTRALLCLLFSSAAIAQTQYGTAPKTASPASAHTGCPWLTEGSAAHALGGEVSVTVKVTDAAQGFCGYSRRQGSADLLEIFVGKSVPPACPPGSASLKGIGNEALTCKHGGPHGESVEMISSRVRDLPFTVMLTTSGEKNPAKPADPQEDGLEQIAELVAGNLY
jgi:hypothetical protein